MMWEYGMGWGWLGMILFWLVPIPLIVVVSNIFSGAVSDRTHAPVTKGKRRWLSWKKSMLGEKLIAKIAYRNAVT